MVLRIRNSGPKTIRVGFWQNGFFADFHFLGRRIFSADFLAGFFFSSFLWEKVPRTILQENPRKNPPKFVQQKSSDTLLQISEEDKRATTNAQNGLVFFFLFSFILFIILELKQQQNP